MNDDEAISQIIEANKDKYLQTRPLCEADIPIKWDKKQGAYDWREWSNWISTGQQLKRKPPTPRTSPLSSSTPTNP
jgi:hypothetical protein